MKLTVDEHDTKLTTRSSCVFRQQDLMDDFEDAEEQSVKDEVHALPI